MNAPRMASSRLQAPGAIPTLQQNGRPADGQYTAWVYSSIKEGKYADVIRVLEREQKAGQLTEAQRCASKINVDVADGGELRQRVVQLQALIKYREDDLRACRAKLNEMPDDSHRLVNLAALSYKEGKFEEALRLYQSARAVEGNTPKLSYNVALCLFRLKEFAQASKVLQEVIERGAQEHPELSVGGAADGVELRSVGNSAALIKTRLIECFNLKAGIYVLSRNLDLAREALRDMPPRQEEELDEITLHNLALVDMDGNPTAGFAKLQFLLQSPSAPPETFSNLLLLFCKFGYTDMAEEVMGQHQELVSKMLERDTREFLEASILAMKSPEEAYRQFNDMSDRHTEGLRRLLKNIQDVKGRPQEVVEAALDAYDDALNALMPCLMAQCNIYWDLQNYHQVMKILRQSEEFCQENPVWQLNMAHAFFLMDEAQAYLNAIKYYQPFVLQAGDSLLSVKENVLANLCVAYIMTTQNEVAEELMRRIEREEENFSYGSDAQQPLHHCIVNLVIGTLYCSKGNFEFGISRVIRSLEPYQKKLEADTWFYAKRCLLALAESLAKHTLSVVDKTHVEVMAFLDEAERHGKKLVASTTGGMERTIATESRMLKRFFLKLREP